MKGFFGKKILAALILVGAAGLCLWSGLKMQEAVCDGVYLISFQRDDLAFTETDICNIEKEGIVLTYMQQIYPDVSNGFRKEEISVFLTNENHAFFTNAYIQEGTFFNGMQIDRKLPVMVLNEVAAIQLFGNRECVGETVYLNKVPYRIIGITAERDGEEAGIYIPYSTKELLDISDLEISRIWCRFPNLADAASVMKKAGYPIETLRLTQIDLIKGVFRQRFFGLLIIAGAYVMYLACRLVWRRISAFRQNGNIDTKWSGIGVLQVIGIGTGIFLLWKAAEIAWCVPPSYKLHGGSWKDAFYGIMYFYLLADVEIDNMALLPHWNLVSIISAIVYLYFFSLCVFRQKFSRK